MQRCGLLGLLQCTSSRPHFTYSWYRLLLHLDQIEHTDAAVWTYGRQAKQHHRVVSCTQTEKAGSTNPVHRTFPIRTIGQSGSNLPILWFGKEQLTQLSEGALARTLHNSKIETRRAPPHLLLPPFVAFSPLVHCSWSGERPWPTTPRKRANASSAAVPLYGCSIPAVFGHGFFSTV